MQSVATADSFRNAVVHLTGIKGTGVAALAEVLVASGARVSGSDGPDVYYTDELLARLGIEPRVGFSPDNIPGEASVLIYSAAYGPENPERREAERRGIPQLSYAQALGLLSRSRVSLAVSGVHGKTTTTAMLGTLIKDTGVPADVIVGSAVPSFGGSATLRQGTDVLIAETCEYKRSFLEFSPAVVIVSSVEMDHQDYYRDLADVLSAFEEFAGTLHQSGALVYCADDEGAREVARRVQGNRPDVTLVPYGFTASGPWHCESVGIHGGTQHFRLRGPAHREEEWEPESPWALAVPGRHMIVNAAGALAALMELLDRIPSRVDQSVLRDLHPRLLRERISAFRGTRRRSEVVGEVRGITILDDYGHHPTAIQTTLAGYRDFYRGRRLVVDFMAHTWSRTAAMLEEFSQAFFAADLVVLNDIYASARETNQAGITGETLFRAVSAVHPRVLYCPDFEEAAIFLRQELRAGDILVTMGAGDNFRVGLRVMELLGSM